VLVFCISLRYDRFLGNVVKKIAWICSLPYTERAIGKKIEIAALSFAVIGPEFSHFVICVRWILIEIQIHRGQKIISVLPAVTLSCTACQVRARLYKQRRRPDRKTTAH
jgi:hypothetical protein